MTPLREWLSEQDFDHLPWPLNVLIEAPPETIIAQKGITIVEALERVLGNVAAGTMGFCPCQGNDRVVALLTPINEVCVEVSLYSLDRSFGLVQEVRRLLDWGFENLPYRQAIVATHSKEMFPLFRRLGFAGPIELPNYHPLGGSWYYFTMMRDQWCPVVAEAA